MECEWNETTKRFDRNCRTVAIEDIASPVRASFKRLMTSCAKCADQAAAAGELG